MIPIKKVDIMSDNIVTDLGTISQALNKVVGRITLDEARSVIFATEGVSADAQMTADDIVEQSYRDNQSGGSNAPQFTHASVMMLNLTLVAISRLQRARV